MFSGCWWWPYPGGPAGGFNHGSPGMEMHGEGGGPR